MQNFLLNVKLSMHNNNIIKTEMDGSAAKFWQRHAKAELLQLLCSCYTPLASAHRRSREWPRPVRPRATCLLKVLRKFLQIFSAVHAAGVFFSICFVVLFSVLHLLSLFSCVGSTTALRFTDIAWLHSTASWNCELSLAEQQFGEKLRRAFIKRAMHKLFTHQHWEKPKQTKNAKRAPHIRGPF